VRPDWTPVEAASAKPLSDFASELVWSTQAPIAILDHSGRIQFANPAFDEGGLRSLLMDARGFLSAPEVEALRLAAIQGGRAPGAVRAIHSETAGAMVELLALGLVPGWSAIIVHRAEGSGAEVPKIPGPALIMHELRGPLLAVRQALDRLSQECWDAAPAVQAALSLQSRAVARLTGVLSSFGDMLRAEELARETRPLTLVSLADVVAEVHEMFDLLAAAGGLLLQMEAEPDIPPIPGDRLLLSRAVSNLVDNAIKYSPPPGPVRVVAAARGSLAVVEVWDRGQGIAPRDRQRIFAPFVRLPEGVEASQVGSGLGLAVVQSVVRAHGGSLSVESDPEAGSVFRLSFLFPPR